jgi:N-acetyl sugar amidotransferase
MDTTVPDIHFDSQGHCNYCREFLRQRKGSEEKNTHFHTHELQTFVKKLKKDGNNKPYDCVVGVSGGVDSSWVLVKAVELGLRPLAVHMDNGWNSELAQNNIANLIKGLGLDLYTHVIEWGEYRSLMQAFFDADVVDIELLYDNAMLAVNYRQAAKFKLSYILSGANFASEGMQMPKQWAWHKYDFKNIRAIARAKGNVKVKTFPGIGTAGRFFHEILCQRKWVAFLDFFTYDKFGAMQKLEKTFGYKPYPYKHYESVFTRFYQAHLLPKKFGIDKRKLHFSTLIMSGLMPRERALEDLRRPPYPDDQQCEEDTRYFLKKMGWDFAQLEQYLSRPRVEHDVFASERRVYEALAWIKKWLC